MVPNEVIFILHALGITGIVIFAANWSQNALTSTIVLFTLIANIFVTKTIVLCGLVATSTDVFVIGYSLAITLLQEYYGRRQALQAISLGFAGLAAFALFSQIHIWYTPAPNDHMHAAFVPILRVIPRLLFASALAYCCAEYLNTKLYAFLQKKLPSSWQLIRTYGSIAITQLLDTILFAIIGLYGVVSSLASIIMVSYCVKVMALAITFPLLSACKKFKLLPKVQG
jgi:uncharacterized integral membrane protein (TIGR00697 family)